MDQIAKYSIIIPCLALVHGIVVPKRVSSQIRKVVVHLIIYFLLAEMVSSYSSKFGNNLYLLLPYLIGEFIFVGRIFYLLIPEKKRLFLIASLTFFLSLTIEKLLGNDWLSVSRFVEGSIFVFFSGYWFRTTYSMKERKIELLPEFWFVLAMMIYFLPTLPIFILDSSLFLIDPSGVSLIYKFKHSFNIISKVFLAISIIK